MPVRIKIALLFTLIMFILVSLLYGFIYYFSQTSKLILWLSFITGTLGALAAGYILSKLLLRPVREIADEVNIISAQNLTHRIKPGNANDEWNYLRETLNDLLNRL